MKETDKPSFIFEVLNKPLVAIPIATFIGFAILVRDEFPSLREVKGAIMLVTHLRIKREQRSRTAKSVVRKIQIRVTASRRPSLILSSRKQSRLYSTARFSYV
jgi:hypothetical protein